MKKVRKLVERKNCVLVYHRRMIECSIVSVRFMFLEFILVVTWRGNEYGMLNFRALFGIIILLNTGLDILIISEIRRLDIAEKRGPTALICRTMSRFRVMGKDGCTML